jgi:flagellar biosynthesis anti-sigma factor FlgM
MEITGKPVSDAIDAYAPGTVANTAASERRQRAATGGSTDKVVLSPKAREIQDAHQRAATLPDVREDNVHQIRRRLAAGTYSIDGNKIAFKMLQESVFNQKA